VEKEGNYEGSGVQEKKQEERGVREGVSDVIENERPINLKFEV
jgi:hypothetical protein